MSGYIGNDGSQLVGALNPSTVVQGLLVDGPGNLKVVNQSDIESWLRNGQVFFANAGLVSGGGGVAASNWYSSSLFNPASSAKNKLVFSCLLGNTGGGSYVDLVQTTTNPALGTNASIFNRKFGGAASELAAGTVTYTAANAGMSYPGGATQVGTYEVGQVLQDILAGNPLILPAGSAYGLQVLIFVNNTQKFSCLWSRAEF